MTAGPSLGSESSGLAVPPRAATVSRKQWDAIAAPGTWWTGRERVAIAAAARSAHYGESETKVVEIENAAGLSSAARRAAALVASTPHSIDSRVVDELEAQGLDRLAYTEIVGVVARVVAIDTATRGVGAELPPLPAPRLGEPSRDTVAGARRRAAFVPMVGGAGPTTALSAVPREDRDQEELHGALYLAYSEMGDLTIVKGLARAQMEAVAARTSLINSCHF